MKRFRSYLDQLKFDPKLWNSLPAKWIFNIRLIVLLVIGVLLMGLFSMFTLPRRLNPQIKIPIVIVSTVLPGANPLDIEALVTKPLEEKLTGLEQLDTITSTSGENVSVVTLQFLSTADGDKVQSNVQRLINSVTLPADALTPTVNLLDFENQPVWTFALTSQSDAGTLMRFAKKLQDEIKAIPSVKEVVLGGFDTQEVTVLIDQNKVSQYGINPIILSQAIKRLSQSFPAGTVATSSNSYSLTVDPVVTSIDDLRQVIIPLPGQNIKLGDIAAISNRPNINLTKSFVASSATPARHAVTFYVYKTDNANIDQTSTTVETLVNKTINDRGGRFVITSEVNAGKLIADQYTDILKNFLTTLALVFFNLFLFLGLRQATLATFTTPLTFLSGLIFMNMFGLTINFLSLFAFLLALGTSIDDTIVTVSAMTTYYRTGKFSPAQTGLLVWRDFIVPIWSTTITTVWAYLPLLLATGIIGEFIKPIPIVVAATMYSSTFFAVAVTLPLLIIVLKLNVSRRVKIFGAVILFILCNAFFILVLPKNLFLPVNLVFLNLSLFLVFYSRLKLKTTVEKFIDKLPVIKKLLSKVKHYASIGVIDTLSLRRLYQRIIMAILESKNGRRNILIMVISFAILGYILLPLGLVKNEFFPKANGDTIYVILDLPPGTNSQTVENRAMTFTNDVRTWPDIRSVVTDPGRTFTGMGFGNNNSAALITLDLIPKNQRRESSITLAQQLRDRYKNYSGGTVTVQEVSGGPPAGSDIQIKLLGDDLAVLDRYADRIINYLKSQKGVIDVKKSVKPGLSKITFIPESQKMAVAGVTEDQVGLLLRSYASGFNLDKIRFGNKEEKTEVNFRFVTDKPTVEQLEALSVMTANGPVSLTGLGQLTLRNSPTAVNHEGGKRTISVTAGVQHGFVATNVNRGLEKYAATGLNLPENYSWKTGGANEENNKSVQSIFKAMILSFILILVTMVVQFRSFRQALIILLLIPLAVSSVFFVFALTATPLSFPALIGILALFGIVVTNAMFIVDKINRNLAFGMPLKAALADAAESRLEPIMLTSLTTILGLIPISISNPLWRGLGGAIIAGLSFSGIIMLFFVPVMYYLLFRGEVLMKAEK